MSGQCVRTSLFFSGYDEYMMNTLTYLKQRQDPSDSEHAAANLRIYHARGVKEYETMFRITAQAVRAPYLQLDSPLFRDNQKAEIQLSESIISTHAPMPRFAGK